MSKRLNVRFALYFFGSLAVVAVGTHFLHAYQVRRTAGAMLERATELEKEEQLGLAVDYLGRYLSLKPDDVDAQVRYGNLLADKGLAKSQQAKARAWLVLNKVLYREPDRVDVRRQVVRLAIELGRYGDARDDIKKLRDTDRGLTNDGELSKLLGRCYEADGKYKESRTAYENSVREAPHDLETYCLLARLLRMHPKELSQTKEETAQLKQKADGVMDDMVKSNERSFHAYLYRANYRRVHVANGDEKSALAAASQDVAQAQKLAPDDREVVLMAANLAREQEKPDEARKLLQHGLDRDGKDTHFYVEEARLEMSLGHIDAALACIRQGLKVLPGQSELLWELADVLTAAGPVEEAKDAIRELEQEHVRPEYVKCLNARLLVRNGQWREARVTLETVYAELVSLTALPGNDLAERLAEQAGVSLGHCLEQIGDLDRAYDAYSRVVARNGQSVAGRLGMATSRQAQGRLTAALDQFRQLTQLKGAPDSAFVEKAQLVLLRNVNEPDEAKRNWPEVDQALDEAEKKLKPPPPALAILRAKYWAAQPKSKYSDRYERARSALVKDFGDPKTRPIEIWDGLVVLAELQDRPTEALALLDEAQRNLGDGVETRLARARYWLRRGPKQAPTGLATLIQGLDRFKNGERFRLLSGLGAACRDAGMTAEAHRLWEQLAAEEKSDLASRIGLFDLAAIANDAAAMDKWQKEIEKIEGQDGVVWRLARASALVGQATPNNKDGMIEARRLLNEIKSRRPNWSRATLCEAKLNDLEGKTDASLALYLKALEMGEREPSAIGRAVVLLHLRRRDAEAADWLGRMSDDALLTTNTQRVAAEVALASQDKARALAAAERAVAADSKNYSDHLWLAYMYWATGQRDRVEPALLRARELAPSAPEVWLAHIQFLIATEHKDKAIAEVEVASQHLTAPAAAPVLAQCHAMVGQMDRAAEVYQRALEAAGNDAALLRAATGFYLRTARKQQAQDLLMRLSKNSDKAAAGWALRTRAILLAAQGQPSNVQEALALLDSAGAQMAGPADSEEATQYRRTRAQVLALRNSAPQRREAIAILEDLIARHLDTPADHHLVAQLYEAANDWARARQHYLGFVALRGEANLQALVSAARSLIRHGEADGAAQALAGLEALAPTAAATKEIKARVFHLLGRNAEAVALARELGQADAAERQIAAALLEEFGDPGAEEMFRSFAAKSGRPQDALVLAQFLIRQQRYVDALDVCERSWDSCPASDVAQICLFALSKAPPDPAQFGRVLRRLDAALAKTPDDVNLLAAQATVFNFQGRYPEAIATYRRILEKDPHHGMALNNLAWLLALQRGNGEDAVKYANQAAQAVGPTPGILDTRGIAYLALGQNDLAIRDLAVTVAEAPSPTAWFHLARAYESAGRRQDAIRAWRAAEKEGLRAEELHPLERDTYQALARVLNVN